MKRKRKHLSKDEIAYMMRAQADHLRNARKSAYFGICGIIYKILTDENGENLSDEKLMQHFDRFQEYVNLVGEYGEAELDLLKDRYNSEIGSEREKAEYRESVVHIKKTNNPTWYFEMNKVVIDNMITDEFDKLMLCHLNTLMDMGWSKKRVINHKHRMNDFVEYELDNIPFQKIIDELSDRGIDIKVEF